MVNRQKATISEMVFRDVVDLLQAGDVLVINDTEVIKARLVGRKASGAKIEILLLKEKNPGIWEVLVKPAKRIRIHDRVIFGEGKLSAGIVARTVHGTWIAEFRPSDIEAILYKVGKVPLPPYIKRELEDFGPYQTVYAKKRGAVAAPTAGLHFTEDLIGKFQQKGIRIVDVTLHCGLATFRPVKVQDIRNHRIESERLEISDSAACAISLAKREGRRIIAVGTTSVRALESAAVLDKEARALARPFCGETNLYIIPGYQFKIIDAFITNFHTPCSTNLILAASFCGLELLKKSYSLAKELKFRFYSFGDAMFIC